MGLKNNIAFCVFENVGRLKHPRLVHIFAHEEDAKEYVARCEHVGYSNPGRMFVSPVPVEYGQVPA